MRQTLPKTQFPWLVSMLLFFCVHLSAAPTTDSLLESIRNDDPAKVKSILSSDKELTNFKERNGRNLLAYAVRYEAVQVIEFLAQKRQLVLAGDNQGNSILHIALVNGISEPNLEKRYKIVQILINAGAPVNVRNSDEASVLSFAAEGSDSRILELLILKGAEVNALRRDTALHAAVRKGNIKNSEILLSHKADPNRYDEFYGHSALHAAIAEVNTASRFKYIPIIKLLLQKGADANLPCRADPAPFFSTKYANLTPLHLAVISDDSEIVKMLMEAGAKATKMPNGKALVDTAKSETVRSLLKNK